MPIPSPDPKKPPDDFALFVRAKEGRIVRRFGSPSSIGYTFVAGTKDKPSEHRWDAITIHPITFAEYSLFSKEYDAELQPEGGLQRATREQWEKQRDHRRADHEAAKKKRNAEEESAKHRASQPHLATEDLAEPKRPDDEPAVPAGSRAP